MQMIDRSTVSKILKEKDKWKAVVENATAEGVTLTDLLIKEKARVFAQAFNIQESELVFSNRWLEKFKKCNNIQRYRAYGEAGNALLESLAEERMKLRRLLGWFTLDRIYNINETGLFYRMPPNQTLSTKPILGQKKDKTRITVLLGANVTGTDKLTSWVIGNVKRLRPFSRINLERLPVHYRANPKAWMNLTIFEEVLRHIDRNFRACCRYNQIIEDLGVESDDPLADSLANALNDFCDLDEEIPTEDVLNENDIIKLIQEEMNEINDNSDDSEDEPVLVSLDDATKSLQTWVTFFEQQEIDEFKNEDGYVFKKYLKTVHKLKMQTKKQAQITSFFS
ncbi:CENP-B homolog protein 2-like [Rhizophagus clarus]|uniref:CENP-B homolog protein 2-like n=1 Tax=Rhizophagus clarus TaxID=94130 RepID=A0A8H3QRF4_9GLOM|nr:CENP-B homolog protein 2-like [Rhizophagus clarus]